jgi:hypothetical protein
VDFHTRPLALAEHGALAAPVFLGALVPRFPFLTGGVRIRDNTSARAGTTRPPMGRRALAFEEKPNNAREQMQ